MLLLMLIYISSGVEFQGDLFMDVNLAKLVEFCWKQIIEQN